MPVKAFPSAYGSGSATYGGRYGIVLHVTNLNDSGTGSFRWAINQSYPRMIVFDVSGVIKLLSRIEVTAAQSFLTIAGQSAPPGGITIDNFRVRFTSVNQVICRYIRFRGGRKEMNDSMQSYDNITNQIFDHCSFSWDGDETASWFGIGPVLENVSVQRCIFGEGWKGSICGGEALTDISMSYHNNLFYNITHRTPNIYGTNGARTKFETINNVVWSIVNRFSQSTGNFDWNNIGNYYDAGNTPINNAKLNMQHSTDSDRPRIFTFGNKLKAKSLNTGYGNISLSGMNADNKQMHKYFQNAQGHVIGEQLTANYFTDTQHPLLGTYPIFIKTADEAFESVKNDVGCNARLNADGSVSDGKDVLDTEWLNNVNNGVYVAISEESTWIVPSITSVTRPVGFYGANPHIPQAFLSAKGVINTLTVHNDIAPSGYTWMEEYLNQVDLLVVDITAPTITRTDSNPTTITQGGIYIPPTGTWTDDIDGTGNAIVTGDTVDVNVLGNYTVRIQYSNTNDVIGYLDIIYSVVADDENIIHQLSPLQKIKGKKAVKKLIEINI